VVPQSRGTRPGCHGTVLYWIGVNFDIDQQKRAEQELRDIFETVPALIWLPSLMAPTLT